jgi:hypothetical protein
MILRNHELENHETGEERDFNRQIEKKKMESYKEIDL